jgi:hypothetical protein
MQQMMPEPKDLERYTIVGRITDDVSGSAPASPDMYVDFAKQDIGNSGHRGSVNAVSNAKRALHLQVDIICAALGFNKLPKREKKKFPQKIQFLNQSGVLAPRVILRLNQHRNLIEHEYHVPARKEAEDYVDIVELFLESTNTIITSFPVQTHFGWKQGEQLRNSLPIGFAIQLQPGTGVIRFALSNLGSKDRRATLRLSALQGDASEAAWSRERQISINDGPIYYVWTAAVVKRTKD